MRTKSIFRAALIAYVLLTVFFVLKALVTFARWARLLFVACIVVLNGTELFLDLPVLQVPVEQVLGSLMAILAGGIIVFSYWSTVSDAFTKKAT